MKTIPVSRTRTYNIWCHIKARCLNPNRKAYKNYGGRGITVDPEWVNSFSNFLRDMGECPQGYSIERIDNDGNYTKSNCKWIPLPEQGKNTRRVRRITKDGVALTMNEWSKKTGIPYRAIQTRIASLGWKPEDAISVGSQKTSIKYNGKTNCLYGWCKELGLDYELVRGRLRRGWSFEDSVEIGALWTRKS